MPSFYDNWTDYSTCVAAQSLAQGNAASGTIDLTDDANGNAPLGAMLFLMAGMEGTTAPSSAVQVRVRRLINEQQAASGIAHGGDLWSTSYLPSGTIASTTVNADSNSGQRALNVASSANIAAGDLVTVHDPSTGGTRLEWKRVSKVAAGVVTCDQNLVYSHTAAQADPVRGKAACWSPVWLPGGAVYEVLFDYGAATSGSNVLVQALYQVLNKSVSS